MSRLLRVPHDGLTEGELYLSEAALHYATRVHRLRSGDALTLFDVSSGLEADAELLDDRVGRVRVTACRRARSTVLPVTLLSAVGKGDKPEQVVHAAATLGAARVVFVHAQRSVAKGSGGERADRLRRVAIETSRQCGRSDVPTVVGPLAFDQVIASAAAPLRLVACRIPSSRPLLGVVEEASQVTSGFPELEILIGPEGGFSQGEIERALGAGFLPVGLGPLVLRTEIACLAALSALWLFADASGTTDRAT